MHPSTVHACMPTILSARSRLGYMYDLYMSQHVLKYMQLFLAICIQTGDLESTVAAQWRGGKATVTIAGPHIQQPSPSHPVPQLAADARHQYWG